MTAGALIPDIPQLARRDPEDIKVVAAAIDGSASFVVTQDKDLLDLGQHQGVMVEPPEFYQILQTLQAERSSEEEQRA